MVSSRLPDAPVLERNADVDRILREMVPDDRSEAEFGAGHWEPEIPRSAQPWPRRRHTLEPEIVPQPPDLLEPRSGSGLVLRMTLLAALITGAGFGAAVYFGPLSEWTGSQSQPLALNGSPQAAIGSHAGLSTGPVSSTARGEPAGLGLVLKGEAAEDAVVLIRGLPAKAMVSVGEPFGDDGWRLPAAHLEAAVVHPPEDFVGAMDLSVEMHLANGALADRRTVRLNWVAPAEKVVASAAPLPASPPPAGPMAAGATDNAAAPAPEMSSARVSMPSTAPPVNSPAAPQRQLDRDEIQALVQRARELLDARDIIAARLPLERAAQGGDADAAFMLGATFDMQWLQSAGVRGFAADENKARSWYELAARYGSTDAARRLAALAH